VCDEWFNVYIEMAGIWLCKVCLPSLVMYIPVSSFVIAVAGREANARHCASLSLLQAKVSEIAEKSSTLATCTALKGRR
jgi:hypothetical protein